MRCNMQTLGIFDSGLGGFNIAHALYEETNVNIVFLADHKNLPYGSKSDDQLKSILKTNMQWFKDRHINEVLIACNTASNYIDYLRSEFPSLTIHSIIEITVKQFTDEPLVIFGTEKTVEVKKYDQLLNYENTYHALGQLAELIEANDASDLEAYLASQLSQYKHTEQNYLLACTHYSIILDKYAPYLKGKIYDSIAPVLDVFKDYDGEKQLEVVSSGNVKHLQDRIYSLFEMELTVNPLSPDFKMVVVSDNHSLRKPLHAILKEHDDASIFVHCGDVEFDEPVLDHYYVVNGNNDYTDPFADEIVIDAYDKTILITHGHLYFAVQRLDLLKIRSNEVGANIVCFGHEHRYQIVEDEDVLIVNPGSLNYNRDGSKPSYMVIQMNGDRYEISRIEYKA